MTAPLHLFPDRGLDQSILVAVLLGMLVLLFFTEVFGWVWAGLVVPGYLASVFAVKPSAGAALVIEGVLTFVVCRAISDGASRIGSWSPFFGRERFFLIVMISVAVRQTCELVGLELMLGVLDDVTGSTYLASGDFASIGLVLVPLLANMFWKLTLRSGLFQIGVSVGLVYLALVLVLLPYTNLSFARLELSYEDVALDFLGSPKAYIILLTGAFIAARSNLLYGWDYNGILVPSLLALSWFSPLTLAITVLEALVLLYATKAFLALPALKTKNLEGPRKLTVVFTLGFVLKYVAGWVVGDHLEGVKLTDYFGFGYVLTSLIAVKMLTTKRVGRVLLPSLQVSLISFVVGSGIGFGLELVAPNTAARSPYARDTEVRSTRLPDDALASLLAMEARAQQVVAPRDRGGRDRVELRDEARLWQVLDGWLVDGGPPPAAVRARAAARGRALVEVARPLGDAPAWALVERDERLGLLAGWPSALLMPGAPGPVLEVARPLSEPASVPLAAAVCRLVACRAIVVAGLDQPDGGRSVGDALAHPRAAFQVAHAQLRRGERLSVRVLPERDASAPTLYVRGAFPTSFQLPTVAEVPLAPSWSAPPGRDLGWAQHRQAAALVLGPTLAWRTIAALADRAPVPPRISALPPPPPATEAARRPSYSETELRVFERWVVAGLGDRQRQALSAALAPTFGFTLSEGSACTASGGTCAVLRGTADVGHLTIAVPWTPSRGPIIAAPRSGAELGIGALATTLWRHLDVRALVLAEQDDAGRATAYHAAIQAMVRRIDDRPAGAIVELRGMPRGSVGMPGAVVGVGRPVLEPSDVPPPIAALLAPGQPLRDVFDDVQYATGTAANAELRATDDRQLAFARLLGVGAATLWIHEDVRVRYLPVGERELDLAARATGLQVDGRDVIDVLLEPGAVTPSPSPLATPSSGGQVVALSFDGLLALAQGYARTGDLAAWQALARGARAADVELRAVRSARDPEPYLVLRAIRGPTARAAVALGRRPAICPMLASTASDLRARLERAWLRRCAVIAVRGDTP